LRWTDKIAITLIVTGIAVGAAAFAVFSFYDPIQAAFFSHEQSVLGIPVEWQFNFQHPFSENEQDLYRFHNVLLGLSVAICALVATLVAVAVWRFRASRHPSAARTTHNTPLEVIWTLVPAFVLIIMAMWSFALLKKLDNPPPSDLTVKVTGNQWFWSYAYPDNGNIQFSSVIVPDEKLAPEQR
jgi:cytochrome c oxidase subunit II